MSSCQMESKKRKIKLENIYKTYLAENILEDINIEIFEGELVAIIGPSGCGKSTIFNIITSIEECESGKVTIDGNISYMHQKDLLMPYKDILDNVSIPLQINGQKRSEAREYAKRFFASFNLSGCENKYPGELSGGMRQRANFLRTFICSSDIMLLDEPFGALDYITKTQLQDWFLDVRKKVNSTILLITHDIEEAIKLSDRIYLLSNKPATVREEFVLSDFDKKDITQVNDLKNKILKLLR